MQGMIALWRAWAGPPSTANGKADRRDAENAERKGTDDALAGSRADAPSARRGRKPRSGSGEGPPAPPPSPPFQEGGGEGALAAASPRQASPAHPPPCGRGERRSLGSARRQAMAGASGGRSRQRLPPRDGECLARGRSPCRSPGHLSPPPQRPSAFRARMSSSDLTPPAQITRAGRCARFSRSRAGSAGSTRRG